MREGLTLLELVFVLVILGILAAVGSMAIRPSHLLNDSRFLVLKIAKAQYEGLGFDHRDGKGGEITDATVSDIGCLTLTTEALDENATTGKSPYRLHSVLSGDLAGKKLCFDHLGRPGLEDHLHPIDRIMRLIVSENGKSRTLSVYPLSGYVTISN